MVMKEEDKLPLYHVWEKDYEDGGVVLEVKCLSEDKEGKGGREKRSNRAASEECIRVKA